MTLAMVAFWALVVFAVVALFRGTAAAPGGPTGRTGADPMEILDERFARGEIDDDEYHARTRRLRAGARPGTPDSAPTSAHQPHCRGALSCRDLTRRSLIRGAAGLAGVTRPRRPGRLQQRPVAARPGSEAVAQRRGSTPTHGRVGWSRHGSPRDR